MSNTTIWQPQWHAEDVEIKETKSLSSGHYKVLQHRVRIKKFSGEWSATFEREQIQVSDSAAVILYDPKLDVIVLIEQFRTGPLNQNKLEPWLLEVVAGYADQGETPDQTAIREAKEEANVSIKQLIPIHQYYTSPGGLTERTWIYCGIIDARDVGGVHGLDEEHEDIKVHSLKYSDVMQLLDEGLLTSSSTLIALLWLKMNHDQFR